MILISYQFSINLSIFYVIYWNLFVHWFFYGKFSIEPLFSRVATAHKWNLTGITSSWLFAGKGWAEKKEVAQKQEPGLSHTQTATDIGKYIVAETWAHTHRKIWHVLHESHKFTFYIGQTVQYYKFWILSWALDCQRVAWLAANLSTSLPVFRRISQALCELGWMADRPFLVRD